MSSVPRDMEIDRPAASATTSSTTATTASPSTTAPNMTGIDTSLYSRQIAALDATAQRRIMAARVLLVVGGGAGARGGGSGVGIAAEIAKDLVLMGVNTLSMLDDEPVVVQDLISQFYLTEADVGKQRSAACVPKIAQMNLNVIVNCVSGEPNEALITNYDIVVLTNGTLQKALALDAICVAKQKKFVWCGINGCFGYHFNNFGADFNIYDTNGEQPKSYMVAGVTQEERGVVSIPDDDTRMELDDGTMITFSGVEGMTELNGLAMRMKKTGPHLIQICDTRSFHPYVGGGYINEVKELAAMSFAPLEQELLKPTLFPCDESKPGRDKKLFVAYRVLWGFITQCGRFPNVRDEADANQIVTIAEQFKPQLPNFAESFDVDLIKTMSLVFLSETSALTTMWGGISAHEIIKAASGKYTPIKQWLFFDITEILPPAETPASDFAPRGCRYDAQISLIGRTMQDMIGSINVFLVGAGAIGCEILKIWAMMGLSCGPEGLIHLTDMDTIEKSNLSRQLLFRNTDVDKPKSLVASGAAKAMNSDIKIKHYTIRVGQETENVFDTNFYSSLHAICAALDNVHARAYLDGRCVAFKKLFVEGGTQGPKGSTTVVVPYMTESYATSGIRDPPEKEFPLCTIHNFPNAIDHTIAWGRNLFEGTFVLMSQDVNSYLRDSNFFKSIAQDHERFERLTSVHDSLVVNRPRTYTDCLHWGRRLFEEKFTNNIKNLLTKFPPDAMAEGGKAKFWSPPKKCPITPLFDPSHTYHKMFVTAAANLRAFCFGIPVVEMNDSMFSTIMSEVNVPAWVEKATVEEETPEIEKSMMAALPAAVPTLKFNEVIFEKDDDSNSHIAFITASSNIRAECYKIPVADFHRTKVIAGKIIPAMITTTAIVSGMQCLQLLVASYGEKPITAYRNLFLNIAVPLFAFQEPLPGPKELWADADVPVINGDPTPAELAVWLKENHKLTLSSVVYGAKLLVAPFSYAKNKNTKISQLSGVAPGTKDVELLISVDENDDGLVIRVVFP